MTRTILMILQRAPPNESTKSQACARARARRLAAACERQGLRDTPGTHNDTRQAVFSKLQHATMGWAGT